MWRITSGHETSETQARPGAAGGRGRTRSKCHMTSITLLTCHSAITSGGAWLGTVLASTQYGGSVVGKVWHVRQLRTIAR